MIVEPAIVEVVIAGIAPIVEIAATAIPAVVILVIVVAILIVGVVIREISALDFYLAVSREIYAIVVVVIPEIIVIRIEIQIIVQITVQITEIKQQRKFEWRGFPPGLDLLPLLS